MILTVGNKVVYPCQGPCLIGPIVKKTINDRPVMFHQLTVLSNGGGELFIPVDNAPTNGIRPLLEKTEITRLLDQLRKPGKAARTWRQRFEDNRKLFASGSAFDLAEIVESLTGLKEDRTLSITDRRRLDRARRLLVCEISEVLGLTEQEAELRVDQALNARKEEVKADCIPEEDSPDAFNQGEDHKKVAEAGDREARCTKAQSA